MKQLSEFLKNYKRKKMLLIYPHPDDEAYVSGGLLQMAEKFSIETKLICLTKGGRGIPPKNAKSKYPLKEIREKELEKACKILGVDEVLLWDYPDAGLIQTKNDWVFHLKKEIIKSNADILVTFDQSGITGHPDHLIVISEIYTILKSLQNKPKLLLRVPDKQEKSYFKDNKALIFASEPTHKLSYSLLFSVKKIKAIFAHKSQIKNFLFRLRVFEWYLFDHQELYHLSDFKKPYLSYIKQ